MSCKEVLGKPPNLQQGLHALLCVGVVEGASISMLASCCMHVIRAIHDTHEACMAV
jgi:hypothetical protein